jgi:hypothetical protein
VLERPPQGRAAEDARGFLRRAGAGLGH